MAWHLVSYDLRKARDYQPLHAKLAEWKAVRALESVWLVDVNGTSAQVRDALKGLMDGDDGLIVLELKPAFGWALVRAQKGAAEWLKARSP